MKLLLITPNYFPDLGPSAPLFTMLCEDLVQTGIAVEVICAVPHFPEGKVEKKYQNSFNHLSCENDVVINRLWIPNGKRSNLVHRLITFIFFQIESALLSFSKDFDVALISNPSLETFLPFWIVNVVRRKKVVYFVWDIYPEIGIQTGIFRNKFVIEMIRGIEDFCLRRSSLIHVLSKAFIPLLVNQHHVEEEKIIVRPVWVDLTSLEPDSQNTEFELGDKALVNKKIILYSGNIGLSQNLDQVFDAAKIMATITPEVLFVFIGDGIAKTDFVYKVRSLNLTNILFFPFQPISIYQKLLKITTLCLVPLRIEIENESIPSKTFTFLSAGKPILAITKANSALAELIREADAGWVVSTNSPNDIAENIRSIISNVSTLEIKSTNAIKYARKNLDRKKAAKFFLEKITELFSKS